MRKIKLVCHVGRAKTATTYLQSHIENIPGVYYFGKFDVGSKDQRYIDGIGAVHYELFETYFGDLMHAYPNPSRNSFMLLDKYSDILVSHVLDNESFDTFVISDEAISDYFNRLGEVNVYYVVSLVNMVCVKLPSSFSVQKILSVTIRSQASIISSFYAHHDVLSGTFSQYIDRNVNDSHRGFWGGLFYAECHKLYSSIMDERWMISFTPYEVLEVDGDGERYLKSVFQINRDLKLDIDSSKRINDNSDNSKGKYINFKKKRGFLGMIGHYLVGTTGKAYIIAKRQQKKMFYVYKLFFNVGRMFEKVDLVYCSLRYNQRAEVFPDARSISKIKAVYLDDNIELQFILKEFDLQRYGYLESPIRDP